MKTKNIYSSIAVSSILLVCLPFMFYNCSKNQEIVSPSSSKSGRIGASSNSGPTLEQIITNDPQFSVLTNTLNQVMSKANAAMKQIPVWQRQADLHAMENVLNNNPTNADLEQIAIALGYSNLATCQADNQTIDNALTHIINTYLGGGNPTQSQLTPLHNALSSYYANSTVHFPSAYYNSGSGSVISKAQPSSSIDYLASTMSGRECLTEFIVCYRVARQNYAFYRSACRWNPICRFAAVIGYSLSAHECSNSYDECATSQ